MHLFTLGRHALDDATVITTARTLQSAGYSLVDKDQPEPALAALRSGEDVMVKDRGRGDQHKLSTADVIKLRTITCDPQALSPQQKQLHSLLGQLVERGVSLVSLGAGGACPVSQAMAQVLLEKPRGTIGLTADSKWFAAKGQEKAKATFFGEDHGALRTHEYHGRDMEISYNLVESYGQLGVMDAGSYSYYPACNGISLDEKAVARLAPALFDSLALKHEV